MIMDVYEDIKIYDSLDVLQYAAKTAWRNIPKEKLVKPMVNRLIKLIAGKGRKINYLVKSSYCFSHEK